jgi:SAM-dependent methyltransferase
MRLGIRSLNPLVWLLEAVGILPAPLMVGFWGMESSRALIAACELGLFDALSEGPRSATDLASELSLDETGTETLLNALSGFGYLRRRDGRYSLRRSARRWFARDARLSLTRSFGLLRVLWTEFDDLEQRIREGNARDFHRPERDAEFWWRYEVGLAEAARLTSPAIVRAVRLDRRPSRLLDAGGGHGAYSAAFCRRYPELQATVLDLEPATEVGRKLIAEQGLSDRVLFRAAGLTTDAWGDGYDVVLLFNVLHVLSPDDAARAVMSALDALAPGGTLAVVDSVHSEKHGDVDIVGGGSELLFYAINSTRAYPEARMLGWIADAGFEAVRVRHLLAMPEVLITARRPQA